MQRKHDLGAVTGPGAGFGNSGPPPNGGQSPSMWMQVSADWQKFHPEFWLNCWSELDGNARMLVTSERIFLCGEARAEALLAEEQELRIRNMRVETVDPAELKKLEELMTVAKGETKTVCIGSRRNANHLMLRATVLADVGGMPILGIAFHRTGACFTSDWPDFTHLFGLTDAENRVIRMLLNGIGAERIAAEQKLSINTVRTHITHAYEKLGISSREQLWARLASYRLN